MEPMVDEIQGVRIGGLEPCSLSDFPGTVAAVIFTQGCNFRCPYCHNRELIPASGGAPPHEALRFIASRRGRLQGVVVSGGEPTLQPGLPRMLDALKGLGFRLKLDTNGSNPHLLQGLISSGMVDFVAMDVKAPPGRYRRVAGSDLHEEAVWRSMDIIASSGVPHLFRTTWDRELLTLEDIEAIKSSLPQGSPFVLQDKRDVRQRSSRPASGYNHAPETQNIGGL